MSAVLLLHHLRKKRWQQQEEEGEEEDKEPPHRHKLKMDTAVSQPTECPGPSSKRIRTQDTSTEGRKRTVIHQLFDASTSVMYTIHETTDEESFKNANGTSSLISSNDGCTLTANVPSTNNCPPSSKIRRSTSTGSMINRTPVGLSNQLCRVNRFCGVNQLHNKKIQTTIKPKVRTVGIQVAFGEKKLLASQETQTDWTLQPTLPLQDYSHSVKTEIVDAV
ncbi:uncharacterized protein LOC116988922 isoform X1 [Amblyraja radiata]|uniref:uncharacterized protein LOC116988922 isoform X1 n=1 Tax=Amblyraja radiata TaxID=386614 RepID=UPI00140392F1|nr:uncharacterized protein LOC116988922 isoform X1 [Amblyraja radiata]